MIYNPQTNLKLLRKLRKKNESKNKNNYRMKGEIGKKMVILLFQTRKE